MFFIVLLLGVFGADCLIKQYIETNKMMNGEEAVFGGRIVITRYHNKGAFLNFLDKKPNLILVLSSALLGMLLLGLAVLVPKKENGLLKWGMALLTAGALSNVCDRASKGYVVDYFSIRCKKLKQLQNIVFNIGDFAIFIGAFLTAAGALFKKN